MNLSFTLFLYLSEPPPPEKIFFIIVWKIASFYSSHAFQLYFLLKTNCGYLRKRTMSIKKGQSFLNWCQNFPNKEVITSQKYQTRYQKCRKRWKNYPKRSQNDLKTDENNVRNMANEVKAVGNHVEIVENYARTTETT